MKTILGSRRRHYMKRLGIFLLTVSLITAIAGCVGCTGVQYSLSISSTAGGSVTAPGLAVSTHAQGTVVSLVASPADGYRFVNWTGDAGTIANVSSASTTIIMNDDYSIIARFELSVQYDLTISSTAGGFVTSPGQGTFIYNEEKVISLVAQPEGGYCFVNWTGDVNTVADINSATTTVVVNGTYSIVARFVAKVHPMVAAGAAHTAGLQSDGRVVAVGRNDYGQCNVGTWTDIVQVAAGAQHTLGLKSDGRVVAVGRNDYGQCDVSAWTGIVQVAGGGLYSVGLKADGTVVAVGQNDQGQCNVAGWTGIVQVAAGMQHTLGLKADGTVVAVGRNLEGQCDVRTWTNIIQVAAGAYHTLGLKSNGTVVAVGWDMGGQLQAAGWENMVQVGGGYEYSLGLASDGSARCVGWNGPGQCNICDWTNIVQIAAGTFHTVGLKSNGTVVAAGQSDDGQCEVGGWTLN
jgi:hypothetical protein